MKKAIAKLMLARQTIRTLIDDELARVVGGLQDCPDITRLASGCTVSREDNPAARKP